ncbi:Flp pilus assembly protein CpaB [Novosphingobium ginsenosidimutans]|uniref:Flp pilus assembly protein CpaB n=1 Tax=Novosphingobium ginsenosidimutans TaxID=1176536 RepID=A0A5B8S2L9_9SPHN|nr:Flp pilus assembly protein CpaB [Novosphingobium ginsenosidimutans]QEA15600.1 Flp pilus assembly protein CpaB [Novosphingobium ginsenosidimutans]
MQQRNVIIAGVAILLGLLAVFVVNAYFSGMEKRQEREAEQQQLAKVVVASQELSFGTPIGPQNLKLANWPASSIPAGAFTSVEEASRSGAVALRSIVPGEPVLRSKISGADGRATLSANLPTGKLAYSIPVTEVAGVAGFVRPGDRVDVILTRQIPGKGAEAATDKMADVILEGVPVLAVDQTLNEQATAAAVAKTATLEVDSFGAQKLALGIQLGTLSLALRNVADQATGVRSTVIPRNLSASNYFIPERPNASAAPPPAFRSPTLAAAGKPAMLRPAGPTMTVYRGSQPSEYEVKRGR